MTAAGVTVRPGSDQTAGSGSIKIHGHGLWGLKTSGLLIPIKACTVVQYNRKIWMDAAKKVYLSPDGSGSVDIIMFHHSVRYAFSLLPAGLIIARWCCLPAVDTNGMAF